MIVATSPTEVITVLSQALRDGRVADALALFEPDAVFVPEPGAHPITGRDAIHAALTGFAALRPTMTSDIRKVVQAGDVATVLNAWRLQGTGPDGSPITMARHERGRHAPPPRRHLGDPDRRSLGRVTTRARCWLTDRGRGPR